MSTTTTTIPAAAIVGSNAPQEVTAFGLSAGIAIGTEGKRVSDAMRQAHSGFQTVSAIIFALADGLEFIPFTPTSGADKGKQMGAVCTMATLIACDGDRAINGSIRLYNALLNFVAVNGAFEPQTAADIVMFTARLAALGVTLEHFNGKVGKDSDGKMVVTLAEYDPAMGMHEIPGMFRIKPQWVANDGAQKFIPDATLVYSGMVPGANGEMVRGWVVAPTQELTICDRKYTFQYGAPNPNTKERTTIGHRVGRNTFMNTTTAMRKAEEAANKEAERKRVEAEVAARIAAQVAHNAANGGGANKTGTGGVDDPERGTGENEPATTPPAGAAPAGTPAPAAGATPAPAAGSQPASGTTPPASTTPPAAGGTTPAPRTQDNDKRGDDAKREDAITPEKLVELVATHFAYARLKGDAVLVKQAMLAYAHLNGAFKTLGLNDFLAAPTDDNARKMAAALVSNNIPTSAQRARPAAKPPAGGNGKKSR